MRTLAARDSELAARIAEVALAQLRDVDVDLIADMVYNDLEMLEVEEVWDRAGSTRDGYC